MNKFMALPTALFLAACTAQPSLPEFGSLSVAIRSADGRSGASRSLAADGTVTGMHASLAAGGLPMIAQSREMARPEDLAEITRLLAELPGGLESPASAGDAKKSVLSLEVHFVDGSSRIFRRDADREFSDPLLRRLEAILQSYRAGYW